MRKLKPESKTFKYLKAFESFDSNSTENEKMAKELSSQLEGWGTSTGRPNYSEHGDAYLDYSYGEEVDYRTPIVNILKKWKKINNDLTSVKEFLDEKTKTRLVFHFRLSISQKDDNSFTNKSLDEQVDVILSKVDLK